MVRDLNSKVTEKDKEIVDLKKEIVILYAERNRSAKHHQSMEQGTIEMGRLREELKQSESTCEMLRNELKTLRHQQSNKEGQSVYHSQQQQQQQQIR